MAQGSSTRTFKRPFYATSDAPLDSDVPEFFAYQVFGPLMPDEVDPYFLRALVFRVAGAWAWGDLRAWRIRSLTAFELLERVPSDLFAKLAQVLSLTIDAYFGPQKAAFFQHKDLRTKEKEGEPEPRFMALFEKYRHDFEGLYSHIASVYAFAKDALFGGLDAKKPPEWYVGLSAKKKAEKLSSPVSLSAGPIAGLTEGWDRHFRNAIAHSRFRCVDSETVEMWDVNEKGMETWRAKLAYAECEGKLRNLEATISAMEAACFLFIMRNNDRLSPLGALKPRGSLPEEERNSLIYSQAKYGYQLEVTDLEQNQTTLCIRAKVLPNYDLPQTEEIIVGGPWGARKFEVQVLVFALELPRVVFGFIRNIYPVLEGVHRLTVEIVSEDDTNAGRVVLNREQLEFLAKADDRKVPVGSIPALENSLAPLHVKFTWRTRPRPKISKPSPIIIPEAARIILP